VTDLDRSVAMYCAGLGWSLLGRFEDHAGFDGAMVGVPGADHHLEFTRCRAHAVVPSPTAEDLIVFYVPDVSAWQERCAALRAAGFEDVPSFNPYWSVKGRTFADPDGYRLVLQNGAWPP
jgi:catechol 2,3-dioxygenase-like lactoylglutathione lyase family enzyme